MKIVTALFILLFCAAGAALAQYPDNTNIGLYLYESDHRPGGSCISGSGFYPVDICIYCLPDENGLICMEFAVSYPGNVIQSTITENNDIISVMMGTLTSGMSVCYMDCQYGWHWIFKQLLYVIDQEPSWVEIIPHPEWGYVQYMNCWDT